MDIRSIITPRSVSLAPMAGAGDSAFRTLCREKGAAFCISEMVSAKALTLGDRKTPELLRFRPNERPFGIQLFGHEPTVMANAAKLACTMCSPDFIDINMGCPAPKITGSGAGSALMRTPELAGEIVAAVCGSVSLPVTVKMRSGWDSDIAAEFAATVERAGAAAITVHGRTRERMYQPPVDLEAIRSVKKAVSVPVVGNGDIQSADDALKMLEYTGCDGVMIGRGALGDPDIFARITAVLDGREPPALPTQQQKAELLLRQARLSCEFKGERIAMLEIRKHAAWYISGVRGAAELRKSAGNIATLADLDSFIARWLELTKEQP